MARPEAIGVKELMEEKIASMRHWKKTKLLKKNSKWDFKFTVMTYNILSQTAVRNHMYLYMNCNPTFLQEEYRISRIMSEILQSKSDIICLQEVEQNLYDNRIKEFFDSNGFDSVFKKRTGGKSDGCAILWNKRKFDLVNHKAIEFRTKDFRLLNRDNIGLIAILKPNHPQSRNILLHVATTHLLFTPRRGDVKLCQIRWLLAELERMSLKKIGEGIRHYHPIILCGDFNFQPLSPLYQFVETGCINVKNIQSGDLSGQTKGKAKGKGGLLNKTALLLHKLGISDATRFEEIPSTDAMDKKKFVGPNELRVPQPETNLTSSSVSESKIDSGPTDSDSMKSYIDCLGKNLLSAIGSSKDPRWVQTLLALGNKQLAADMSAKIENSKAFLKSTGTGISSEALQEHQVSKTTNETTDCVQAEEQESFYHDLNERVDFVQAEEQESFYHCLKFVPAYKYHHINPQDIPITSMTGKDCDNVDHIFYNVEKKNDITSFTEGQLRLLSIYSLLYAEDAKELGGLPNAYLGSDHICLMAQFGFSFNR